MRAADERPVKVTLASNINHSYYAAMALHGIGALERYLGPVLIDGRASWPRRLSPRFAATRSFPCIEELPLRRLIAAEVESRMARVAPLKRDLVAEWNSVFLDRSVAARLGWPDIVHINTAGLVRTARTAKARGAVLIADHREVHPRDHTGADPLLDRLEVELSLADFVLANSRRSADSLVAHGVPAGKVITLELGVDVDRFTPGPAALRTGRTGETLLFVGAVSRAKGVDVLVDALQSPSLEGATLRIAGRLADATLSQDLEANPRVRLLGPVDRRALVDEYRSADTLVLPSLNDGFGLVAVEALACGTPVVVTSACGVAPLVTADVGRVVPPSDALALAHALRQTLDLARDPQVSDRARSVALDASWDRYRSRLASWYLDVAIPYACSGGRR